MATTQGSRFTKYNRPMIILAVGAVIYAALWGLRQLITGPNLLDIAIRPDVVVPIFCGLIWGPMIGVGVGIFGSFLGDFIIPGLPFPFYWDIAAGLLGLVAKLPPLTTQKRYRWRDYLVAEGWTVLAIVVSLLFITLMQVVFEGLTNAGPAIFWPVLKSNLANGLILIPLLLWLYQRFGRR